MDRRRHETVLAVAFVALVVLAASCKGKPRAGDRCQQGEGACADPTTLLTCLKGVFTAMPCHGSQGCAVQGNTSQCDNSVAAAGDVCDENGDYACSADKKAALSCRESKFVVEETCKGEAGCTLKPDGLYCDNDLSDLGDPCHTVGDFACTTDKLLALRCGADHTMAPLNSCRGAKGCRVFEKPAEKKVDFVCDDSIADPNDACDEEGEKACASDRRGILECKAKKFVAIAACSGGCSFDEAGNKFDCASAELPPRRKKGR